MRKTNKIIFVGTILIFLFSTIIVEAASLSMGPVNMVISGLRGGEYTKILFIHNAGNEETDVSLTATGDAVDWISFYAQENLDEQITSIKIPVDDSVQLIVKFNIPMDIASGNYSSIIFAQTVPGEGQVGVGIRIRSNVQIEVSGTQDLSGVVDDITTKNIEINHPLRILIYFKNTGNVIAKPLVDVEILKNGNSVDQFNYESQGVNIGKNSIEEIEWDSTGQTIGDYVANVKVYLGGELLKEENLDFKILERGTLTAQGYIVNVEAPEQVESGSVSKIVVGFMNIGEIDIRAKISGEVYLNDNIVDTLESDEVLVKVHKTETITAYFKPTEDGTYLIKSNVVYEGKKEAINDITIDVGEVFVETTESTGMFIFDTNTLVILFVVFVVSLIMIGIIYDKFKKSKKVRRKRK